MQFHPTLLAAAATCLCCRFISCQGGSLLGGQACKGSRSLAWLSRLARDVMEEQVAFECVQGAAHCRMVETFHVVLSIYVRPGRGRTFGGIVD